jgi:proton-coupled amino acid transporter
MRYFIAWNLSIHQYLLMLLFPVILLKWVRNLKYLTPVSLFAPVVNVTGLGITFFYLLQDLPHTSNVRAFGSWKQLPLYSGTAVYACEGVGVVSIRKIF